MLCQCNFCQHPTTLQGSLEMAPCVVLVAHICPFVAHTWQGWWQCTACSLSTFLPIISAQDAAEARQQQRQGSPVTEEGGMRLRKLTKRVGSPARELRAARVAAASGGGGGGGEADAGEPRAQFRGVTRLERERKWVARVWNGQKQLTLGRFETDVAAAQASFPGMTPAGTTFQQCLDCITGNDGM